MNLQVRKKPSNSQKEEIISPHRKRIKSKQNGLLCVSLKACRMYSRTTIQKTGTLKKKLMAPIFSHETTQNQPKAHKISM